MTKVVLFDRSVYDRSALECLEDSVKYLLACSDTVHCRIYDSDEYTRMLNDFVPKDEFVYTYIVDV